MLTRANNLDAVRFWAAMTVLWSHSVPLTQGGEQNELSFRLSGGQTTTGTLAVFVFFALSGYLITRSFERARSPWHYVRARVLRIMPALIAMLAVLALLIGPLASELAWESYFASTEPYRYILVQGSMFFGWVSELPGVFSDHPLPTANGSIWTLRHEAELYGLVFLLGVAGLLRKEVTLALYVLFMGLLVIFPGRPATPGHLPDPNAHLDLGAAFLAGAVVHQWKVPLDRRIALGCLVVFALCMASGQILYAQRTVLPYLALYVALSPSLGRIPFPFHGKDVSYGLYIWAWPLTQLVVGALEHPRWWVTAALTTPLALGAGWLSWTLIEERALALKDRPLFGRQMADGDEPRVPPARHAHG